MVGSDRRDCDPWVRFVVGDFEVAAEINHIFPSCSPDDVGAGNIATAIALDAGFTQEGKAITESKEAGDLTSQDVDGRSGCSDLLAGVKLERTRENETDI
jgi:hypothetical protein